MLAEHVGASIAPYTLPKHQDKQDSQSKSSGSESSLNGSSDLLAETIKKVVNPFNFRGTFLSLGEISANYPGAYEEITKPEFIAQLLKLPGIQNSLIPADLFTQYACQAGAQLTQLTLPHWNASNVDVQKIYYACKNLPYVITLREDCKSARLLGFLGFSGTGDPVAEVLERFKTLPETPINAMEALERNIETIQNLTAKTVQDLSETDRYTLGRLIELGFATPPDEARIHYFDLYRAAGAKGLLRTALGQLEQAKKDQDHAEDTWIPNAIANFQDAARYSQSLPALFQLIKLEKEDEDLLPSSLTQGRKEIIHRIEDLRDHGLPLIHYCAELASKGQLYPTHGADILEFLAVNQPKTGYSDAPLKEALHTLNDIPEFDELEGSEALQPWKDAFVLLEDSQRDFVANLGDLWTITRHAPPLLTSCARLLFGTQTPSENELQATELALKQESPLHQADLEATREKNKPPIPLEEIQRQQKEKIRNAISIPPPKKSSGGLAGTKIDVEACRKDRKTQLTALNELYAEYVNAQELVNELDEAQARKEKEAEEARELEDFAIVESSGPPVGFPPPPPPIFGSPTKNEMEYNPLMQSVTFDSGSMEEALKLYKARETLQDLEKKLTDQYIDQWPLETAPTFEQLTIAVKGARERLAAEQKVYNRINQVESFPAWVDAMKKIWGQDEDIGEMFSYEDINVEWEEEQFNKWIALSEKTSDKQWETVNKSARKRSSSDIKKDQAPGSPEQRRSARLKTLLVNVEKKEKDLKGFQQKNLRLLQERNTLKTKIGEDSKKVLEDKTLAAQLGPKIMSNKETLERLNTQYSDRKKTIETKEESLKRQVNAINHLIDQSPPVTDFKQLETLVKEECRQLDSGEKILPVREQALHRRGPQQVQLVSTPQEARQVQDGNVFPGFGDLLHHVEFEERSEDDLEQTRLSKYMEIAGLQSMVAFKANKEETLREAKEAHALALQSENSEEIEEAQDALEKAQDSLSAYLEAEAFTKYVNGNKSERLAPPTKESNELAFLFVERWKEKVHKMVQA